VGLAEAVLFFVLASSLIYLPSELLIRPYHRFSQILFTSLAGDALLLGRGSGSGYRRLLPGTCNHGSNSGNLSGEKGRDGEGRDGGAWRYGPHREELQRSIQPFEVLY